MIKIRNIFGGLGVLLLIIVSFNVNRIKFILKVDDLLESINLIEAEVEFITLVNIGDGDREYLASVINSISECNPKVLAIDAFFLVPKEPQKDMLLSKSIAKSPTVLAIKGHGDGYYTESLPIFKNNSIGSGIAQSFHHYGLNLTFKPIRIMNDVNRTHLQHFSLVVAHHFDSVKTNKFRKKVKLDQEYLIDYKATINNFKMYDYGETTFNCDDIQGKIVLMGYLGPTNEDKFKTPLGLIGSKGDYNPELGDMYGPVIIANQILSVLDNVKLKEY